MSWTNEQIQQTIQLREQNFVTRHIAEIVGKTRNAIIGKLDRLGYCKPMNPKIQSKPAAIGLLRHNQCRYPTGHPGDDDFTFCDADALPFQPYCLEHHKLCYYVKTKEEAAA